MFSPTAEGNAATSRTNIITTARKPTWPLCVPLSHTINFVGMCKMCLCTDVISKTILLELRALNSDVVVIALCGRGERSSAKAMPVK